MVRMKKTEAPCRTVYYLAPGQTLENTKVSERALALIVPQSAYTRFKEYAYENDRVALLAEREAKRLAALKQASYEMSKTWEDTAENIQKRRKEELLSRRKLEDADRLEFMREMAAKNAKKRAEIVKQAREMILYRKPQCRLINRALLVSEVLRELNEQIKFQDSIKGVEGKLDKEYAENVMKDVEKFHQEEKKKREARLKVLKDHQKDILKQIEQNQKQQDKLEKSLRKSEMQDLKNMSKEIREIEEKELRNVLRKKEELNKISLEAIEERRQYELKLREEDEFQAKNMAIYNEMKREIEKMKKDKARVARKEKLQKHDILARKLAEKIAGKEEKWKGADERAKQIDEQKMAEHLAKLEEQRKKRIKAHEEMQQQLKSLEEEQQKRKSEEDELKLWETMQRYKRDEFNRKWNQQKIDEERKKRLDYGKTLKKQMAEKMVERREAEIEADDSVQTKEMINKANEKVLAYGESILQESRGIRPTFPIEKAIEQFKREVGLVPSTKTSADYEISQEKPKRRRQKKAVCPPVRDEDAFFFA